MQGRFGGPKVFLHVKEIEVRYVYTVSELLWQVPELEACSACKNSLLADLKANLSQKIIAEELHIAAFEGLSKPS